MYVCIKRSGFYLEENGFNVENGLGGDHGEDRVRKLLQWFTGKISVTWTRVIAMGVVTR